MHSLISEYLAALRLDSTQAAALRSLGGYQGKQQRYAAQSPKAVKGLHQIAVVEPTESSNQLENIVVALSRLKSLIIRNATPKSRSEQEIAGCHDALALVFVYEFTAHRPFNERVVLQLHTLFDHFNYVVGRYISLERIFENTTEGSRNTFEASSQDWHQGQHDVKLWLDYFWGALLRVYQEFEERVGTIEYSRAARAIGYARKCWSAPCCSRFPRLKKLARV